MNRHTLNDGVTPDAGIAPELYKVWLPQLAPPASLLGDYYKRGLAWEEFEDKYNNYLDVPEINDRLRRLIQIAKLATVTVLCIEDTPDFCHRRLLVERSSLIEPTLEVELK